MKKAAFHCLCLLALAPISVSAYELGTHGRLTYEAYKRSVIGNDSQIQKALGIDKAGDAFGPSYYDVSGNKVSQREKHDFEQSQNRMPEEVDPLSIPGWLLRGAIREDDWTGVNIPFIPNCQVGAPNPQDDPYPKVPQRPLNHFYDPVHHRALTILFSERGQKAPNWASGSKDIFTQPNTADIERRNHFTIVDAREAMYRALTGERGKDGVNDKAERNKYWATTFWALGDVVHLVQDMAQPQHTRNDPHSGACIEAIAGHKSVYEAYIEDRALSRKYELPSGTKVQPLALTYDGYDIPKFDEYATYFSNQHKHKDDIFSRAGLADYSNRGFFSAGKNLGTKDYSSPSNDRTSYKSMDLFVNWNGAPLDEQAANAKVSMLLGDVPDTFRGVADKDIPLTTYGAWDEFLEKRNKKETYSLNRYNYDAMADLLIPRAVAYSAGIINHFFRARISARYVNHSPLGTAGKAAMLVRNNGKSTLTGTFRVYYDQEDETRVLLATQEGVLPPASEGDKAAELIVEFQAPVITTTDKQPYTVVFWGHDEQATDEVVTGAKAASAVLAFNGKDGLKTIDPRAVPVTAEEDEAKLIRSYEGPFVGGSRTRPHPSDSAYGLVFHPFNGQVGIADYAANKTVSIAGAGAFRNTVVAANWLSDQQFIVAYFSTRKTQNYSPFYTTATVTFTIYDWDPANSAYAFVNQKTVPISLAAVYPSATMGLFWGENPWPRDGNWWSFDVNHKGEMVTAMYSVATESEPPVKNYVNPSNCTNSVLVQIGEVSTTTYRYFALTIKPDGSYSLGNPVVTSTDQTTAWRYYEAPSPPSYPSYCEGRLNKQTVDRAIRGARLAHVDFTPKGGLAIAVNEETSDWGLVANLPSPTSWSNETDYAATRSWKANGVSLATSNSTGTGSVNYENGTRTSTYDESHREIEIYDLQYDGTGKPWALWVDNHWQASSSGGGILKNDTAFYVGNGGEKSVLFQATSPPGYLSLQFGPPIFPADIVTNPYGPGAVAVAHILGQRDNNGPDAWYTPQPRDHFVNYIDADGNKVDLYAVDPQQFDQVRDFRFLP